MAGLLTGNKFNLSKDIPDLSGKVYVITGGSAGIGFGIVAHILQHNAAKVYLLSNREEHAEETQGELKNGEMRAGLNLKQTNYAAKQLFKLEQIDALVCNAGLGVDVYNETRDGLDFHMQVNHFSQFHLAMHLFPILQRTPNSRLVLQSSEFHRMDTSSEFASVEEINTEIGPSNLYNRTKLAQVLFIRALVRRLQVKDLGTARSAGPWINATNPGGVATDQTRQAEEAYGTLGRVGIKLIKPFMKDPVDEGCRPALFAATGEDVVKERIQGQYIVPDRKVTEPSDQAKDEELQEKLWTLMEQILSDKLGSLSYQNKY